MKLNIKEKYNVIKSTRFSEKEVEKIKKIAKKNDITFNEAVRGIINKNLKT